MKKLSLWLFFLVVMIAAGCGGGSSGGGANGDVGIFVTDDLNTFYSHVWVTVHRVELQTQGGGFVNVFDDPDGRFLNLRALNDGNQRYSFLGKDRVPEGVYTGIRFTLDKDVRINASGGGSAQARVFDPTYVNPSNSEQSILALSFAAPRTVAGATNDIIVDFVLASWTENGTLIQNAVLTEGAGANFNDESRHDEDDFDGSISGLSGTAPNFTFTLNLESNNTATVMTDSNTSIYNNNGSLNPQLANGKRVEVRGKWNPATRALLATSIKIKASGDDDDDDEFEAKGVAVDADLPTGTFDVELGEVEGFLPTQPLVHVVTSASTHFRDDGGLPISQAQFFDLIAAGNVRVEVEGSSWTLANNRITAFKAKIEDDLDGEHRTAARGSANTINSVDGTFRIALTEWEGFSGSAGMQINVVTNGSTTFKNIDGQEVTQAEFFVLLATAARVEVSGAFNGGTIVAEEAKIKSPGGGGQAEAFGTVSNINSGAQSFDLTAVFWSGFTPPSGLVINVVMSGSATFRNADGDAVTSAAFFGLLSTGTNVEVEGSWNAGTSTLTATKAKIED